MSLQAVLCPGREGGTWGPPGRPMCPGRAPGAAARPFRWVALGSWEWGPGSPSPAGTGSQGPSAPPAHCSQPLPRWTPSHSSS